jgi:branched-chain amino acid transport system permease protein
MDLLLFYLRKLFTILKNEVLVLPSRVVVVLFFLFLLLLPVFTKDPYLLRIVIFSSIFAIFAASWDLLSGFTGQMNFGHALFFGVAAYTSALLNLRLGFPPWLTIPLGALMAVIAGLVVGIPCLRLRGPYLALATLAFPIILMGIIFTIPDLTGGELGVSGIKQLAGSRIATYYICVIVMLGLGLLMWKIGDSKIGIIFHAIREDEVAVRASGINTTRYKLLAFSLSGFFAGVAGGLYTHFIRIAGPSTLEVSLSFQAIIWAIFGGVVTIYGPIAGVFILYPLMEFLRILPEIRTLLFGLTVVIILLFMPEGLTTWIRDKMEEECPRCKVRNVAWRKTCRVCTAPLD